MSIRISIKQDNIFAENRLIIVSEGRISLASAGLVRQLVFFSNHNNAVVVSRRAVDGDVLHVIDNMSLAEGGADKGDSLEALAVLVGATVDGAEVGGGDGGGSVVAPGEDALESRNGEVRRAAGDGGKLEARVEDTTDITVGILASGSEAFDLATVLLLLLRGSNLGTKSQAPNVGTTAGHQGVEALVLTAFTSESVLQKLLRGDLLVTGKAVGVVGFLVRGCVVDLDDLEALEALTMEGSGDTVPQLAAWLNSSASDTSSLLMVRPIDFARVGARVVVVIIIL